MQAAKEGLRSSLFERLMAENILETSFRIAEMLLWSFRGVLALEDIEDKIKTLHDLIQGLSFKAFVPMSASFVFPSIFHTFSPFLCTRP